MKTAIDESPSVALAGTPAIQDRDTEVSTGTLMRVSDVVNGETPFQVVPTAQAAIRIGPIKSGFLSVVMDLEDGVRVYLSGVPPAGGDYEIRIHGNRKDGLVVEHGVS